jgi:iron-sulfur cluster repair protein YtfE (RIC family)
VDVTSLLERDHREIRALLTRLRSAGRRRQLLLFGELRSCLEAHDAVEEEVVYPLLCRELGMREEAETFLEEHQAARDLMDRLETMDPGTDLWTAMVGTLSETIETHLREEEEILFPELRQGLSAERVRELSTLLESSRPAERLAG